MHSQKIFGDRTRFDRDRCALATATNLQHPERLAEVRSALISSARQMALIGFLRALNGL